MQKGWRITSLLLVCANLIIIFILPFLNTFGRTKQEWKGQIEYKDGMKIIKNPQHPLSNNAGRIVYLKEVIRIRDNGKDIVFKAPYNLVIDQDENIYFVSYESLYKYDRKGNLKFKIIRIGQGPGEAESSMNFTIINEEILVHASSPLKIMKFDLNGILKEEIKLEIHRNLKFITEYEDRIFVFNREVTYPLKGKTGYVDFPNVLYAFSHDFSEHTKIYSFPVKFYVEGNAWFGQAFLGFAIKDLQNLFIFHTSEYEIYKFDLQQEQIVSKFKRKYKRVKRPKVHIQKKPGFIYGPPKEYYQDIQKLLIYKDNLWVFTSGKNEDNDWLIDVYDMNGRYIDNFYLHFPDDIEPRSFRTIKIEAWGDFLFSIDQNKDGYYSIAKYEIIGD